MAGQKDPGQADGGGDGDHSDPVPGYQRSGQSGAADSEFLN